MNRTLKKYTLLCALAGLGLFSQAQTTPQGTAAAKQGVPGISVTGTVTDAATGKPLRGVNVGYKSVSAAITDSLGQFALKVPSTRVALSVGMEGYQTKQLALRGQTAVSASLYEDTYPSLYDAGTLATGTVLKSQTPYSLSTVEPAGAWTHTAETPSTYLQGRVAGLNAVRRSGTPNAGATLTLRGINSLYGTNQPLIVVDGVIFDNNDYNGSIIGGHYTDPLSAIDVRDIDNITVMKDGSSLYGTKGGNGVIFITTARARELSTRIDFATYGGINFTPQNLPVLNADEYRTYIADLLKTRGLSDAAVQAMPFMNDDRSNPDYYTYHNNTDWQKTVFKQSYSRNVYMKVTGGDNIAKYGLSLGYMNADAITSQTGVNRYNMRFNADLNLSRKMTATANLSYTFNEQTLRDQGATERRNPIFLALVKSPLLRQKVVSAAGVESPLLSERDTFNVGNPLSLINTAVGENKAYRFFGSLGFNYTFSEKFGLSTIFGMTNDKVRETYFIPRKGTTPDTLANEVAFSRGGSSVKRLFSLYNDTRLTFTTRIGTTGELTSRLGGMYLYNKTEWRNEFGYNMSIDELKSVGNGAAALRSVAGGTGEEKWLNGYFNTDYALADKYIFSVNVGASGSSRFGGSVSNGLSVGGEKFAVLPSVRAAWLVSSESFMRGSFVDLLKLRGSYGLAGNDDVGNYAARQTYGSQSLLGVQGLTRTGFGNNQLQWEVVKKTNLGADVALLKERISFSLDWFKNKTDKMLSVGMAPAASGILYDTANGGAMSTKGVEAAFNARIINTAALKWDLGFTVAKYRSTVDKLLLDRLENSYAGAGYLTAVGSAPALFYGYKTAGVYSSDAVAAGEGLSARNADGSLTAFRGGDVRFADLNGDKVIDTRDRTVIGNPAPDFFGGITSRLQYKNLTLEALATFSKGGDVYNYTRAQLEAESNYYNQTKAVVNRWRTNGQVTAVPRAVWGDPMGNSRFSDRWIEDGSYLRLRTVSLSYDIGIKPGFLRYVVVYATGYNLVTLSKYMGYDPEFNATESVYGRGVDNTLEPQVRSAVLGVRVGL